MNGNSVCFSSNKDDWETPPALFNQLNEEFRFTLDAAASIENAKVRPYFVADEQGGALTRNWQGTVWLNPPYSRWQEFIRKAYTESLKGVTVVCLLPSRTCTKAWHDYVMKAYEIRFIRGRLRFVGATAGAPFPSCIVVFRGDRNIREILESLDGPAKVTSFEVRK